MTVQHSPRTGEQDHNLAETRRTLRLIAPSQRTIISGPNHAVGAACPALSRIAKRLSTTSFVSYIYN